MLGFSLTSLNVSLLLPVFLAVLFLYLIQLFVKSRILSAKLSWLPGPPALPILGNYYDLISAPPEVRFENLEKYWKKYGKTYLVWIGTTPVIICQDLDVIQEVFKDEERVSRPAMYLLVREYLGPGLLFGEGGDRWKMHRRILSDSFHTDKIEGNITAVVREVNSLISQLERHCSSDKPVDLITFFKDAFFHISLSSVAGVDSDSLEKLDTHSYIEAIESMSNIVMSRLFSPLLQVNSIFSLTSLMRLHQTCQPTIHHFISKIVGFRKSGDEPGNKHKNIVDAMLEMKKNNNDNVSNLDVDSQVSNHLFASFDTLSTNCSYLLLLLANNEKIQEEVLEEVDSVCPNILSEGISLKDASKLKLLDRCVKETLRMFPSAAMMGRRTTQPITTKHGTIPAGTELYVNMHNYHRNPVVFPHPDTFDPDRFLPDNSSQRPPNSWIPFGLGSRICIGQKQALVQSKVAAAMVLKRFKVKPYEKPQDLKLIANLILKSRDGIRVYLEPRDA